MSRTSELATHSAAEAGHRRTANFFIVGAPKCGTTAWFEYLRSHPNIFMTDLKEPSFFATDMPELSLVDSLDAYDDLFRSAPPEATIIGDASTAYLDSTTAAAAIRSYNKDAKILVLLRDQADQLPSLHNHNLWLLWEDVEDFPAAWKLSGRRRRENLPAACPHPRMVDYESIGQFCEQVERYLDLFHREQILVIHFNEWISDPRPTYRRILTFLGLDDDGRDHFPRVNDAISYRAPRIARFLAEPPASARRLARAIKKITGLKPATVGKAAEKGRRMLTKKGYKNQLSSNFRDEIRLHYAAGNMRLKELIGHAR